MKDESQRERPARTTNGRYHSERRTNRNAIPRNEDEAHARERALGALARMRRDNFSLSAAARAEGINATTVRRYVGSALRQNRPGARYSVTAHDRIARTLNFLTPQGTRAITVRDSRTASRIGEYMNAVRTYVNTGEPSAIARFQGRSFRAGSVTYRFATDLKTLDELADAGVLAIEGLYRAAYGG